MKESEIQCLKDNVFVEIETTSGEKLVAKVIWVFDSGEYDEHELFYEVISTNLPESYSQFESAVGYGLEFGRILTVKTHQQAKS